MRGGDQEAVVLFAEDAGYAGGDLGKKGMNEVRDDKAGGVAFSRDESAGGGIWLVVEFLDALEDAAAGFFADIFVIAEDLRYRDDGDAELPRDIFHCYGHLISSITHIWTMPG